MDNPRKTSALLLATLAFLISTSAAGQTDNSKKYVLTVVPGDAKQVIAEVRNLSTPQAGNDATTNIGSLVLSVDKAPAGLLISSPSQVLLERVSSAGTVVLPATVTPQVVGNFSQIAITGINPPIRGQEILRITISDLGCGLGSTWTAPDVFNGGNLSGQEFEPADATPIQTDVACGSIACGESPAAIARADDPSGVTVKVERGLRDADGTCSTTLEPTAFYVTNRLGTPGDHSVQLTWNDFLKASFKFDASIVTADPKLAWLKFEDASDEYAFLSLLESDGVTFRNDLTCSSPNVAPNGAQSWLPRRYGNPDATVPAGATKFKVNTATREVNWPTTFPTNFYLGNEALVVVKIAGSTWNLESPTTTSHSISDFVVYTPLKKLESAECLPEGHAAEACPYTVGTMAKWCRIPGTGSLTLPTPPALPVPYEFAGDGDPIFTGGDL